MVPLEMNEPPSSRTMRGPGDVRPPVSRAVLQAMRGLLAALVALVACGGTASFAGDHAGVTAATQIVADAMAVRADASDASWTSLRESSPAWRASVVSQADLDLDAIESDLDEEDPLWGVLEDAPPLPRRALAPREPDGAPRGARAADPSRFAAGTRLARGPPA